MRKLPNIDNLQSVATRLIPANTFIFASKRILNRSMEPDLEEYVKETYALFGLAYYYSEVLHRSLCIYDALRKSSPRAGMTRPRVDELLHTSYSMTLGQVAENLDGAFDPDLSKRLREAVKDRNFLAHHFWFEQCHLMPSKEHLLRLQADLHWYRDLFNELDAAVTEVMNPLLRSVGVTDESLAVAMNQLLSGAPEQSILPRRRLLKQETIVKIWNVPVDDASSLVFETSEGLLWQLCDVGLGWTGFERVTDDWKENEILKPHLPATINPRPPSSSFWNYEFLLRHGKKLKVSKSEKESAFRWNLK
jgi:hypothetical protein